MTGFEIHGYDLDHISRLAWRTARAVPAATMPPAERHRTACDAIIDRLLEAGDPPDDRELWNHAVSTVSHAVDRELRLHGYSTRLGRPMTAFAAFWIAPRAPPDALEESVIEKIALSQIMAALSPRSRWALTALAEHGHYAVAADATGVSYGTMRSALCRARSEFYGLWYAPDPPGRLWAPDRNAGTSIPVRDWRQHRRRHYERKKAS